MIVSVESPYHNTNQDILNRNINYAILAVKNETRSGNAAYASHLLNTQYVDNGKHFYINDDVHDRFDCSREEVIRITNELRLKADKLVFYIDFGYSNGMITAKNLAMPARSYC